jgi:hypothetical protein
MKASGRERGKAKEEGKEEGKRGRVDETTWPFAVGNRNPSREKRRPGARNAAML